jgi:hypothetical protein
MLSKDTRLEMGLSTFNDVFMQEMIAFLALVRSLDPPPSMLIALGCPGVSAVLLQPTPPLSVERLGPHGRMIGKRYSPLEDSGLLELNGTWHLLNVLAVDLVLPRMENVETRA